MALFPFRNPITEATGCLGGIAMHICTWSGIRCPSIISGTPFAGPAHGKSVPDDGASARILLCAVAWAQTRYGTCSPIWNGIGFGKALTFKILLSSSKVLIKPLEEDFMPERSNLVESHWSNQWLTQNRVSPRTPYA